MKRIPYMLFRILSAVRYRITRRFTPAGTFVLSTLVASAVIGVDTNLTMAYQLFTLLLSLVALSFISRFFLDTRAVARRVLPQFGTAGQPLAYRVIVSSGERGTLRDLVLEENLADPRPSYKEFSGTADPGGARRKGTFEFLGYSRWLDLVAAKSCAAIKEQTVPAVSQNSDGEVRGEFIPTRRGIVQFEGVTISKRDPLGLLKIGRAVPLRQSVLILPKRYPLPAVSLPGDAGVPAGRRIDGRLDRRFRGVRIPAGLPSGRSASTHPLEKLGAFRQARGEGISGRVFCAPCAGP